MRVRFSASAPFKVSFSSAAPFKPKFTQVIEVHTIPSNYGLITWDGSTLTVS